MNYDKISLVHVSNLLLPVPLSRELLSGMRILKLFYTLNPGIIMVPALNPVLFIHVLNMKHMYNVLHNFYKSLYSYIVTNSQCIIHNNYICERIIMHNHNCCVCQSSYLPSSIT